MLTAWVIKPPVHDGIILLFGSGFQVWFQTCPGEDRHFDFVSSEIEDHSRYLVYLVVRILYWDSKLKELRYPGIY